MNILEICLIVFWMATTITVMAEVAPSIRDDLKIWQQILLVTVLFCASPFMLITQAAEAIIQNFVQDGQDNNDNFKC